MPMIAQRNPDLISVADYLVGEEESNVKHEFLGGVVHAMAGGSNQHNEIAGNAFGTLYAALLGKKCKPFNSDTKVRITYDNHTRFYYPDAMVVCEKNGGSSHFQDKPVVIVEVLSDSTRRNDLFEKRDAYFTIPSLQVLLFVEQERMAVNVHRRETDGRFGIEGYRGTDAAVPLLEIGVRLRLEDIYRGVTFEED